MRRNTKGRPLGVGFKYPDHSLRALSMDNKMHIGMDVRKRTIPIAVMNPAGQGSAVRLSEGLGLLALRRC